MVESRAVDQSAWVSVWTKVVTDVANYFKLPNYSIQLRDMMQDWAAQLDEECNKTGVINRARLMGWKGNVKDSKRDIIKYLFEKRAADEKKKEMEDDESGRKKFMDILLEVIGGSGSGPDAPPPQPIGDAKVQVADELTLDNFNFAPVKVNANAVKYDVKALGDLCTLELMKLRHVDEGISMIKHRHVMKLGTVKIPEGSGAVFTAWGTPTTGMTKSIDPEFVPAWGVTRLPLLNEKLGTENVPSLRLAFHDVQIPACTAGYSTPTITLSVPFLVVNESIFKMEIGQWTELTRLEFAEGKQVKEAAGAGASLRNRTLKLGDSDEAHAEQVLKLAKRA
ncbi:unnamed protein product, partial [Prorocentrum cordatum]